MQALIRAALEAGAAKAAPIAGEKIVYSDSFREICRGNQCGCYGNCWMCPPEIGEIRDLMAAAGSYPGGVLYQTIGHLEDSFDVEGMQAAAKRHVQVSQKLQAAASDLLEGPFLHLTCGGCHLCERCAKWDDRPCRYPEKALPSLEGYGVDVYNTALAASLKYINGPNTVTYFGLLLCSEGSYANPDPVAE